MKEKERLALLILLAITAVSFTGDKASNETYNASVTDVVDGDTIDVRYRGREDTVRLLGVDTPEVHTDNNPEEYNFSNTIQNRACLERYGEKASNFVKQNTGNKLNLIIDPDSERRGDYDRLLAYVNSENKSINRALLEEGLARVYISDFSMKEEYLEIQKEAQEKDKGLWSC